MAAAWRRGRMWRQSAAWLSQRGAASTCGGPLGVAGNICGLQQRKLINAAWLARRRAASAAAAAWQLISQRHGGG